MSILNSAFFVSSLGIFLFILKQFATSCTNLVGSNKQNFLLKKRNILAMVLSGALLSALTQSSSVVIIMIIGLVQGNLISERNGLAAVLGTEVGTTMTGQLLSLPKGIVCYIFTIFMLITMLIPKLRRARKSVLWFGLLISSMYLMGIPINQLTTKNEATLITSLLLSANQNIGIAMSIGFGFTALIQSSSALTALSMNLGRAGILNIHGALGLVIGANLGTCITGFIASFAFSKSAKTIVLGQILFNFIGVLLVFILFDPFLCLVSSLTSSSLIERQIANGQTIFNVCSVILILPIFPLYFKAVKRISRKLL